MLNIYKALLNGLSIHGPNGFLWVKGELCTYCFPGDIKDEQLSKKMEELIRSDPSVFFVMEVSDKVEIKAYPKEIVIDTVKQSLET